MGHFFRYLQLLLTWYYPFLDLPIAFPPDGQSLACRMHWSQWSMVSDKISPGDGSVCFPFNVMNRFLRTAKWFEIFSAHWSLLLLRMLYAFDKLTAFVPSRTSSDQHAWVDPIAKHPQHSSANSLLVSYFQFCPNSPTSKITEQHILIISTRDLVLISHVVHCMVVCGELVNGDFRIAFEMCVCNKILSMCSRVEMFVLPVFNERWILSMQELSNLWRNTGKQDVGEFLSLSCTSYYPHWSRFTYKPIRTVRLRRLDKITWNITLLTATDGQSVW